MRVVVEVPSYDADAGVRTVWDDGFEIAVEVRDGQAVIEPTRRGFDHSPAIC